MKTSAFFSPFLIPTLLLTAFVCLPQVLAAKEKIPVIVLANGDDGLTLGLKQQLKRVFQSSSDFLVTEKNSHGTLLVRIETNLHWKQVGDREFAQYSIEILDSTEKRIGGSVGECRTDQLVECALQTLRDTRMVLSTKNFK
jgi:hypothetical protein